MPLGNLFFWSNKEEKNSKGEKKMRVWNFYTAKEIKPHGWMKKQLEIQAAGLSGNLDKVWRDVRDSAWIGGDAEGWERVPYWLDGFIPLAYLLENEDMIMRAKKYIDAILAQQQDDGWLAPCSEEKRAEYDTWAVQLLLKVLVVYYECSNDERIPDVIYRTLKNYYEALKSGQIQLFGWGRRRWYETFIAINFMYDRCKEAWLQELGKILKEQGTDYAQYKEAWKRPINKWAFETHIVNIGMMLKEEAVCCDLLEEAYTHKADQLYDVLYQYNGRPTGLFTGDECLSGVSPIQGTELCAVAEQMYSYEQLYAYTGEEKWAELLELAAFNAFPATVSDDMWTHQYDQMSNQISCVKFPGKSLFRTNGSEAHLFGLEPNFGCCTANMNQAFPKLALSIFMHHDQTILHAIPLPAVLHTDGISIEAETDYPFKQKFVYKIKADHAFDFKVRIPSFAKQILLNGKLIEAERELCIKVQAGEMIYTLSYDADIELLERPYDLRTVKCGSLLFSLPISYKKQMHEFEKNGVERKYPYCDYEYIGTSDWNYGFAKDVFTLEPRTVSDIPFSSENPPVVVKAKMKQIAWGFEDGYDSVCAKVPESRKAISEEKTMELYPYGCAKLRMTEMPMVEEEK